MILMRDMMKADSATVRAVLRDGGAIRQFQDNGDDDRWIIYTSAAGDAVPVAALRADDLVKILAGMTKRVDVLEGESLVSKREVAATVDGAPDRHRARLEARAVKAAELEQSTAAALAAYDLTQ